MNYKVPKIFTTRSRNMLDGSILKHAGSQMFQNRSDYFGGSSLGGIATATTPHTERYGVTPYLTNPASAHDSLLDMEVRLHNKGRYTSGSNPHFFKQVKDAEQYIANLNMGISPLIGSTYSLSNSYAGKDVQYDVDFFIRQANNYDVLYK